MLSALLTNIHLPQFLKGSIYNGPTKHACVPGLNCYSCPGAAGACPIGSFQAVAGSSKFSFSYYITGLLILFGVLLGRFICGFLCPQGILEGGIPLSIANAGIRETLGPLFAWKAGILAVIVITGVFIYRPFCKWLCPLGALLFFIQ